MNPSSKSTSDKINKYRQMIKQNIIQEQNGTSHLPSKQQRPPKDFKEHIKITSSLSRSNIRKNPADFLNLSRNLDPSTRRAQQQTKNYAQNKINDHIRIQDRSRLYNQPNKNYDNHRVDISSKTNDYVRGSDIRTTQKQSTSKSPAKTNPYLMQTQIMTKRKNSHQQNQRLTPKASNPSLYEKTPSFHNLSSFETFSPRPSLNSGLPPLFPQVSVSSHTTQHQVKVLLEQNQILSMHLNEKMQRIKNLQRQLKTVVKSQVLHEQKYDIEVSQLTAQKQMLKKSNDEQVKTLVMEVKKLNDELVEKENEWQERVNMIRKTNLEEQQQTKKNQMKTEEKNKSQIQELKIKIAAITQESQAAKQSSSATIQNLKAQNISLNQSIEKFAHLHKMEKSQLALQHDSKMKVIKQQLYRKIEIMNLDKIRKENELNGIIDSLTKEMKKLNNRLEDMKHETQFSEVKDMQQKGKMNLEIREEKEKVQKLKQQENIKLKKLSQAQLQATSQTYEHQISQLRQFISNMQALLQARGLQITNLYKQIADTRKNYQSELNQKDRHIIKLEQKMEQFTKNHLQQQQCFKIKLAQLTQANQQSIKEIYENKISEQQHLLLDKDQILTKLREKVSAQLIHLNEVNQLHVQQVKGYEIRIEQLEQKLSSNVLKQRNISVSNDKGSIILQENLLRQAQSYQKAALVKDESIKQLQKMIQTKDQEIQQLEAKIQLFKKSHKQELSLLKQQHKLTVNQLEDAVIELKQQLEYSKKQQSKRAEQFSHDKRYYSNQLKELKNKGENDFNQWVDKLSTQINELKTQNKDLTTKLSKLQNQYQQYKQLWNEQQSINKLLEKEKEFTQKMNQNFTAKQQKLIESHQKDIHTTYKPKIDTLNQLLRQKEQQILDMKTNYHQLEVKFEKFIEEKQIYHQITQQVLTLGNSNDGLAQNYLTLSN